MANSSAFLLTSKGVFISLLLICLGAGCEESPTQVRISRSQKRKALIDSLSHFAALPLIVPAPKDNPPTPDKVELGRLLFFDPILSGNKDVACASCHHPSNGYAESLEISIGVNGRGFGSRRAFLQPNDIPFTKRNSPTILNTAFNGIQVNGSCNPEEVPMFWDLRVSSLEKQALEPLKSLEEMRGRSFSEEEILPELVTRLKSITAYRQLFKKAFGPDEPISAQRIAQAIATFERTLLTQNSRFDQYMRGDRTAISTSEQDGFQEFIKAGCGNCHNGPMFSDFQQHVLGVPENDKLQTFDLGIDSIRAFRTPSLRNLRFTFPYMHNGRIKSLKHVLEFYEDISFGKMRNPNMEKTELDPLVKQIRLKVKNMNSIISFLNTLNDDNFDKTEPQSVPSGLSVGGNIK